MSHITFEIRALTLAGQAQAQASNGPPSCTPPLESTIHVSIFSDLKKYAFTEETKTLLIHRREYNIAY